MQLPGKVRVTETVGVAPAPSTVLIEFVGDDGTVYDSSGPIPTKSGVPISYGHVYVTVQLDTAFEGLSLPPGGQGGRAPTDAGKQTPGPSGPSSAHVGKK
jgi:hypothetical protein